MVLKEIQKIWQIVLLSRSPADLQHSKRMLAIIIALLMVAEFFAIQQTFEDNPMNFRLLFILSLLVIRWLPLVLFNQSSRSVQSLTALFGADLLLFLPLLLALHVVDATKMQWVLMILFQFAYAWQLLVGTFVYKKALETNWLKAFLIAISVSVAYIFAIAGITQWFGDSV